MDINESINWMPGMELTADTFLTLREELDRQQQTALRAAIGVNRTGRLIGSPFANEGIFVKNSFEMDRFRCLAILPSGRLIDVDERVTVDIPMLYGSEYYLGVGIGDTLVEFEKKGIPHMRPQYKYKVCTAEELEKEDMMPVVRFHSENGLFSIDPEFIPPCLSLAEDARFKEYTDTFVSRIQNIVTHKNLEEGEGKRVLTRYMFRLKSFGMNNSIQDYQILIQETAHAVDYYIASPNLETPPAIPQPMPTDIQKWLKWIDEYLAGAVSILDTVVVEDNTIDYEALLAQAKKELYEQLNPELHEKLLTQIKEELNAELSDTLRQTLTTYIEETLQPTLKELLGRELYNQLSDKLFTDLYDKLYNALYVPPAEEEEFMPMI